MMHYLNCQGNVDNLNRGQITSGTFWMGASGVAVIPHGKHKPNSRAVSMQYKTDIELPPIIRFAQLQENFLNNVAC